MRYSNFVIILVAACLSAVPGECQQAERSLSPTTGRTVQRAPREQARDLPVQAPVLGFRFNKGAGLQSILGLPGSARLGPAVPAAGALTDVVSGPECCYALGLAGEQRQLVVLRDLRRGRAPVTVAGLAGGVTRFVLSPSGRSALVYYQDSQRVAVVRGLPATPSLAWQRAVTGIAAPLAAMAVSDDAQVAVAADGENLLRITAAESWSRISALAGPAAIAFAPNGHDAVVAERATSRVLLIRDVLAGGGVFPLADARSGIGRPVAVAIAADRARAIVANTDPPGVTEIRLADATAVTARTRWVPLGLQRLAGDAIFLLGRSPGAPLLLYDGDSSRPRITLVSAPRAPRALNAGGGK